MTDMLLVYITCGSIEQAEDIGRQLLDEKISSCINILPQMHSMYLWPPQSGQIEKAQEVVLLAKTIESKFAELAKFVTKIHTYDTPCIIALPVAHVSDKYYRWIKGELAPPK